MPDRRPESPDEARARAFRILRRHGRDATSFQTLERGFDYFFDGDDAYVAYRDTGGAWVAAGEPVAAPERAAEVAARFIRAAREHGRRASFFGVDQALVRAAALSPTPIGEEPIWDPAEWKATLGASRKLREQLRRARAKGLATRVLDADEVREGAPLRPALDGVAAAWLKARSMAPMAFLVQVDPFARPEERCFVVAEREGEVVALLVAVPVYEREGWLVEHVFRASGAPNGTAESLIDRLMQTLEARGSRWVSLGLAPLSGALPLPLRAARRLGRPFYNFEGLYAFKARLHPQRWEPRFLGRPRKSFAMTAILDTLTAFTPRGLLPFALATVRHLKVALVHALWILLVPWTVLLALSSQHYFPSPLVKWGWVAFDVILIGLMASLTRRWRPSLVRALAILTGADAALTFVQAAVYNAPRADRPLDWLLIAAALAAPTLAAALFFVLDEHP